MDTIYGAGVPTGAPDAEDISIQDAEEALVAGTWGLPDDGEVPSNNGMGPSSGNRDSGGQNLSWHRGVPTGAQHEEPGENSQQNRGRVSLQRGLTNARTLTRNDQVTFGQNEGAARGRRLARNEEVPNWQSIFRMPPVVSASESMRWESQSDTDQEVPGEDGIGATYPSFGRPRRSFEEGRPRSFVRPLIRGTTLPGSVTEQSIDFTVQVRVGRSLFREEAEVPMLLEHGFEELPEELRQERRMGQWGSADLRYMRPPRIQRGGGGWPAVRSRQEGEVWRQGLEVMPPVRARGSRGDIRMGQDAHRANLAGGAEEREAVGGVAAERFPYAEVPLGGEQVNEQVLGGSRNPHSRDGPTAGRRRQDAQRGGGRRNTLIDDGQVPVYDGSTDGHSPPLVIEGGLIEGNDGARVQSAEVDETAQALSVARLQEYRAALAAAGAGPGKSPSQKGGGRLGTGVGLWTNQAPRNGDGRAGSEDAGSGASQDLGRAQVRWFGPGSGGIPKAPASTTPRSIGRTTAAGPSLSQRTNTSLPGGTDSSDGLSGGGWANRWSRTELRDGSQVVGKEGRGAMPRLRVGDDVAGGVVQFRETLKLPGGSQNSSQFAPATQSPGCEPRLPHSLDSSLSGASFGGLRGAQLATTSSETSGAPGPGQPAENEMMPPGMQAGTDGPPSRFDYPRYSPGKEPGQVQPSLGSAETLASGHSRMFGLEPSPSRNPSLGTLGPSPGMTGVSVPARSSPPGARSAMSRERDRSLEPGVGPSRRTPAGMGAQQRAAYPGAARASPPVPVPLFELLTRRREQAPGPSANHSPVFALQESTFPAPLADNAMAPSSRQTTPIKEASLQISMFLPHNSQDSNLHSAGHMVSESQQSNSLQSGRGGCMPPPPDRTPASRGNRQKGLQLSRVASNSSPGPTPDYKGLQLRTPEDWGGSLPSSPRTGGSVEVAGSPKRAHPETGYESWLPGRGEPSGVGFNQGGLEDRQYLGQVATAGTGRAERGFLLSRPLASFGVGQNRDALQGGRDGEGQVASLNRPEGGAGLSPVDPGLSQVAVQVPGLTAGDTKRRRRGGGGEEPDSPPRPPGQGAQPQSPLLAGGGRGWAHGGEAELLSRALQAGGGELNSNELATLRALISQSIPPLGAPFGSAPFGFMGNSPGVAQGMALYPPLSSSQMLGYGAGPEGSQQAMSLDSDSLGGFRGGFGEPSSDSWQAGEGGVSNQMRTTSGSLLALGLSVSEGGGEVLSRQSHASMAAASAAAAALASTILGPMPDLGLTPKSWMGGPMTAQQYGLSWRALMEEMARWKDGLNLSSCSAEQVAFGRSAEQDEFGRSVEQNALGRMLENIWEDSEDEDLSADEDETEDREELGEEENDKLRSVKADEDGNGAGKTEREQVGLREGDQRVQAAGLEVLEEGSRKVKSFLKSKAILGVERKPSAEQDCCRQPEIATSAPGSLAQGQSLEGMQCSSDALAAEEDNLGAGQNSSCGGEDKASNPQELDSSQLDAQPEKVKCADGDKYKNPAGSCRSFTRVKQELLNSPEPADAGSGNMSVGHQSIPEDFQAMDAKTERENSGVEEGARPETLCKDSPPAPSEEKHGSQQNTLPLETPAQVDPPPLDRMPAKGTWKALAPLGRRTFVAVDSERSEYFVGQEVGEPEFGVEGAQGLQSKLEEVGAYVQKLQGLRHPNLVTCLGAEVHPRCAYAMWEHCPAPPLAQQLQQCGPMPEDTIIFCLRQVLLGVQHLHAHGLAHGRLSSKAVLISGTGEVKVKGPALPCVISGLDPRWMPPEAIRKEVSGPPADVWAIGCLAVEMASGSPPWANCATDEQVELFIAHSRALPPFPQELSPWFGELVQRCLTRDPRARPSCATLLQHPFVGRRSREEPGPEPSS